MPATGRMLDNKCIKSFLHDVRLPSAFGKQLLQVQAMQQAHHEAWLVPERRGRRCGAIQEIFKALFSDPSKLLKEYGRLEMESDLLFQWDCPPFPAKYWLSL